MLKIHKFQLPSVRHSPLFQAIPEGSGFLMFRCQDNRPTMWFEIDTEKPMKERWFRLFWTGDRVESNDPLSYMASDINQENGNVWHLYEVYR